MRQLATPPLRLKLQGSFLIKTQCDLFSSRNKSQYSLSQIIYITTYVHQSKWQKSFLFKNMIHFGWHKWKQFWYIFSNRAAISTRRNPALLQNVPCTMVLIKAKQILFTFILPSKGLCVSLANPCNKYGNEMAMKQICLVSFTSHLFFFFSYLKLLMWPAK